MRKLWRFAHVNRSASQLISFSLALSPLLTILIAILVSCESENGDVCSIPTCELEAENVLAKLDIEVDPCDDFYLFACGRFLNRTEIPDDKTSVDEITYLDDKLKDQLNEILNTSITSDDIEPFANSKKLYKACINEGERKSS